MCSDNPLTQNLDARQLEHLKSSTHEGKVKGRSARNKCRVIFFAFNLRLSLFLLKSATFGERNSQ